MRGVIAGAYTSTASLQMLETRWTSLETHYSTAIPCQAALKPAGSRGGETTHRATSKSLALATVSLGRGGPAATKRHSSLHQSLRDIYMGALKNIIFTDV